MKFKMLLILSAAISVQMQLATAATSAINVTNFDSAATTGNQLFLKDGVTALSATESMFYIGTFDESALTTATSIQDLFDAFTFKYEIVNSGTNGNPSIGPGYYTGDASVNFTEVDNTSIYIFIANASSIENATEALIWKSNSTVFQDDESPIDTNPDLVQMLSSTGTVIFGFDAENNDPYRLLPIPEPSGFALLGLGAVATLLRRRR